MWGCSSAGRALALHARGQEFDPPHLLVFFQFTDGKADGGLGQMQFFSGFRNTFALIYGDENTDVAKCHNPVLSRLKYENT